MSQEDMLQLSDFERFLFDHMIPCVGQALLGARLAPVLAEDPRRAFEKLAFPLRDPIGRR
jgi:hypothetical protein